MSKPEKLWVFGMLLLIYSGQHDWNSLPLLISGSIAFLAGLAYFAMAAFALVRGEE